MAHRTALLSSIGLTLLLALGIFTARARLFEPTTTDATVTYTPATVVDTSADANLSGGELPATEAEQYIAEAGDEHEADEPRSFTREEPPATETDETRSITSGEQRDDDDGHEDNDDREDDEDDDD
jgi:hypothetical protein